MTLSKILLLHFVLALPGFGQIWTVDHGGRRITSANYTIDGSVGEIGGVSSNAAPLEVVRNGYIGQLTEIASISVTGTPSALNETAASQLSGAAILDDSTVAVLSGGDLSWTVPVYPVTSINTSGLAMASAVYATTNGVIRGNHLGLTSTGQLLVMDNDPDNHGLYAGDSIPDSWQIQYFGLNNANAAPNVDVDGTGQNNLFKYVAGLDPTNPASVFVLKIANVTGQPTQKSLIYNPIAVGRTYTPQFVSSLPAVPWSTLTTSAQLTNGNQVTVTDTNATQARKIYRVRISLP